MTPLPLTASQRRNYLERLFGPHDFSVVAEVLDMDERPKGTAVLLDGQVNLHEGAQIRRTASLSISDPEGAFDFSDASGWSPRSVWADRLVRVRHVLAVDGAPAGRVSVTVFVGPPSTISRSGAEVSVECQDKTALAVRGCPPFTVKKGLNAVSAIRAVMRERTGEFRFRMPRTRRRLSKDYSTGWDDEVSPWEVASRIAREELGMQLLYSADGFLMARKKPAHVSLVVPHVTGAAEMSADFTAMTNWVRVRGRVASVTKDLHGGGTVTTTAQPQAIAVIPADRSFSPFALGRKDVPRYWPELVESDSVRTEAQARDRARRELAQSDQLRDAPSLTCVPFFHGDADDLVRFRTPGGSMQVRLGDCSIPLGVGGDMTVGAHRWVSRPQGARVGSTVLRTRKVKRPKRRRRDRDRDRRND